MKKATIIKNNFPIKTSDLAKLFGVSTKTLKNWEARGLKKVKYGVYDLYSVFVWHLAQTKELDEESISNNPELAESQKKYWEQKALLEGLKVIERSGESMLISKVRKSSFRCGRIVKDGLKVMIEKLSQELAVEDRPFEIKNILRRAIAITLNNLSVAMKEMTND